MPPRLLKASQGDVGHAVGLLTTQPPELQDPGEAQESGSSGGAWEGPKGGYRSGCTRLRVNMFIYLKTKQRALTSKCKESCSKGLFLWLINLLRAFFISGLLYKKMQNL